MKINNKTAVISGVSGQDGTYLTEYLLGLGYKVVGIDRRTSLPTTGRLTRFMGTPNFTLVRGDVTDLSSIQEIISTFKPDEFYHLGAQSHVAVSWKTPISTCDITGMGTLNCLEAIRKFKPDCRFYFAGSSEQFGNSLPNGSEVAYVPGVGYRGMGLKVEFGSTKLDERSPMHPESPYAAAKVFGYNITHVYRRSYGLFASTGILFNHESNDINSPVLIRENNNVKIERIVDLLPYIKHETFLPQKDIQIWDGESWQNIKAITVRPTEIFNDDQRVNIINTRHGVVFPTKHHNMLNEYSEKRRADSFEVEDKLLHGKYPTVCSRKIDITENEAWLIGYITGDGWVDPAGNKFSISCLDEDRKNKIITAWGLISKNSVSVGKITKSEFGKTRSLGFNDVKWCRRFNLRGELYNSNKEKRVPEFILNANKDIQLAFLNGYNEADGLKANKCTYKFKNFKTKSAHLAHGLLYLISATTKQNYNITYEDTKGTGEYYYSMNLLSNNRSGQSKEIQVQELISLGCSQREIYRKTGISRTFIRKIQNGGTACIEHHMSKPKDAIKKIVEIECDWVADIQTTSGKFMAGVGTVVVANSPVRGKDFVTRKITSQLAEIARGSREFIELGNMDSYRDWGFAGCFVKAMHAMLQLDEPDDFVIATGETHSVREFFELACGYFSLEPTKILRINKAFIRPKDVDVLIGDSSKARDLLGWKPKCSFEALVEAMCQYDECLLTDPTNADQYLFPKEEVTNG